MMFLFFLAVITAFSAVVMALWNAILPQVLGVKTISFIQALGILLLSKILFGGFGGGRRWGGRHGRESMQEKWRMLTPEEQEKFKAEWKNRCGRRWGRREPATTATETNGNNP